MCHGSAAEEEPPLFSSKLIQCCPCFSPGVQQHVGKSTGECRAANKGVQKYEREDEKEELLESGVERSSAKKLFGFKTALLSSNFLLFLTYCLPTLPFFF